MTDALTCPQCGAVARSDAAWCSLCFAQLVAGFDPLTAPLEELLSEGNGTAVMTQQAPAPAPAPATWTAELPDWESPAESPATSFDPPEPTPEDPAESTDSEISDVDVMLAMLAAEHRQAEPTSELVDRLGDKGARVLLIVGGTVAIAVVVFVMMAVLGTLT